MAGKQRKGSEPAGTREPKKARAAKAMSEPTGGNGPTAARGGRSTNAGEAALRRELRDFAASHPEGWNHDEWNGLLGRLSGSGFDASSPEEVGRQLERERLALRLEGVPGIGPARVKKLAEEFGNLWQLRHADPDRIASAGGVKREIAERIQESLR